MHDYRGPSLVELAKRERAGLTASGMGPLTANRSVC